MAFSWLRRRKPKYKKKLPIRHNYLEQLAIWSTMHLRLYLHKRYQS
jgi:hypothetical protein